MAATSPELILMFPEYRGPGERLAAALSCPSAQVQLHRFPDCEVRVRLPTQLPQRVAFCRSLSDPDAKLIELLLASQTARELGAAHLTLVAPYLCYMRQDMAFVAGEAVSQKIIGKFLAAQFDAIVTVDPHLHRTARIDQALPMADARALSSAPVLATFLAQQVHQDVLLIGPDVESRQWVAALAARCGLQYGVAEKVRRGDRDVSIQLPPLDVAGRAVVLVDDMISTGNTLARISEQLKRSGAAQIDALVVHALCDTATQAQLHDAGIDRIWSTDSVSHASNAMQLAPLLAAALRSE